MQTITLLFAHRKWNPISWLIRWAIPQSRFALAMSSHCLVDDYDLIYEANMLHGTRGVARDVALDGLTIIKSITYTVPDAAAAIAWAKSQVGKPYDWLGAFGLGLAPYRNWAEDDKWFCYEFGAGVLRAGGRDEFANLTHISEIALMAIKP